MGIRETILSPLNKGVTTVIPNGRKSKYFLGRIFTILFGQKLSGKFQEQNKNSKKKLYSKYFLKIWNIEIREHSSLFNY